MIRSEIASTIETMCNVTNQRTLVNRAIQMALEEVYQSHDFPYYINKEGVIELIADYTEGTVAVTNGSTTVTGAGTTWTSAMEGRKIRFNGENAYYRIDEVSAADTIVLEHEYQGDDDTDATYVIFKDEYRLAPDVDRYKTFRQLENNIPLSSIAVTNFDRRYPMPNSYADPVFDILVGTRKDTYTTGTVSASISTPGVLTGDSTSWTSVEGLGRMSTIKVGSSVYTIKSVDSDTQLTLFNPIATNIAALTSYEIHLENIVVQFYNIPIEQRLLYYRYFRMPYPLMNDVDVPDMPRGWDRVLVWGGLKYLYSLKGDINKFQLEAENQFNKGLAMMKAKVGSLNPDAIYRRKSVDSALIGRRLDGLEDSSFDRRYSM